jgi:hypothetical protein
MIKSFLQIRLIQTKRIADQLGLPRAMLLIGLLVLAGFFLFYFAKDSAKATYVTIFFLGALLVLHLNRPDRFFLQTHFDRYKELFFAEYLVFGLPFAAAFLFYGHFLLTAVLIAGIIAILPLKLKLQQNTLNTALQRLLPDHCFEWKSGVRRSFFLIIPAWILGLSFSFLVGSIPVTMVFIGIIVTTFYERSEPLQMLLAFEKKPELFLKQKAGNHLLVFMVLMLPLFLAFLVFHASLWYIPGIIFVVLTSILLYAIFTKYAFYIPNSKSGAAGFFQALGAAALFLPVLIPLLWLLTIRFYFKSIKQLNPYLHDFD